MKSYAYEPGLELHSRVGLVVEAHHHVNGPDTGRNSRGNGLIKTCVQKIYQLQLKSFEHSIQKDTNALILSLAALSRTGFEANLKIKTLLEELGESQSYTKVVHGFGKFVVNSKLRKIT